MNSGDSLLPVLLRRYVMTWTHHVERYTRAVWGFEMPESRLIWHLGLLGPTTASQLVKPALMGKFQVSRSLDRLRRLGLISSSPHPQDQRSELIALTDEGLACARTLTALSNKWADATEAGLSPRQHQQLMVLVEKLQAGAERLGAQVDADLSAQPLNAGGTAEATRRAQVRSPRHSSPPFEPEEIP